MAFQDHFSTQSEEYARFRPRYPAALFEWLASVAPGRALAWDCGTGNGQAAVALADHFEQVIASDPSAEQIAHAEPHARIRYVIGAAEEPPAEAQGVDLVTCAQAYHWLDHVRFCDALRRVMRPDGILAAWGYGLASITPEVDGIIFEYYSGIVGPYWPPDRTHIENHYRSLPFPADEIPVPSFTMTAEWSLDALLGYLDTWSATRRYQVAHRRHPLDDIRERLQTAWAGSELRSVRWPLFIRAARLASAHRIKID
jgi:ubiquinone/menaquinone biosynthesis C-methylase UbiE